MVQVCQSTLARWAALGAGPSGLPFKFGLRKPQTPATTHGNHIKHVYGSAYAHRHMKIYMQIQQTQTYTRSMSM